MIMPPVHLPEKTACARHPVLRALHRKTRRTARQDRACRGTSPFLTTLSVKGILYLRLRTDNGTQYGSHKFRKSVQTLGIGREFICRNTLKQNGHGGSFHGALKGEYVWPHEFARFQDAEVVLAKAFVDYNKNIIHSALGYLTPNEFVLKLEGENK